MDRTPPFLLLSISFILVKSPLCMQFIPAVSHGFRAAAACSACKTKKAKIVPVAIDGRTVLSTPSAILQQQPVPALKNKQDDRLNNNNTAAATDDSAKQRLSLLQLLLQQLLSFGPCRSRQQLPGNQQHARGDAGAANKQCSGSRLSATAD
jgi:hypothetical protein